MSKFKYSYEITEEDILKDVEKVLAKYDKKLNFEKKAHVSCGFDGMALHFEMEPEEAFSRSLELDRFEATIEKIEKELQKKMGDIKVEVVASSCDLDIFLRS